MSRMGDLHIEVTDAIASGEKLEAIAKRMRIPLEWVKSVEDDFYNELNEQYHYADRAADADAIAYGNM